MNLIFIDNNIPDLVLVELIKIDLRHLSKIRFLIIIRLHINEILIIKSTIDSFKKDVSILFQFLVKIINFVFDCFLLYWHLYWHGYTVKQ